MDTSIGDDDIADSGSVDVVKVESDSSDADKTKVVNVDTDSGDGIAVVSVDSGSGSSDGVASISNSDDSASGDIATTGGSSSKDEAIDVDSGDDDANTMRHGGIAAGKGSGRTNIGGAVLAVCGVLLFLAVSSGVWCYYKSKHSAFVSLKVIDVEEHEYGGNDTVQEEDEQAVMMTVVTDGPAVTACSDEDIL